MRLRRPHEARERLTPRVESWVERAYPNLIHYNKLDKGAHFAAWEQPKLFCQGSGRLQTNAQIVEQWIFLQRFVADG